MASIVYIARDIERALGKEPKGDYYIITNTTPYALEMKKNYKDNIFLIENDEILDTYDLLAREDVGKIIDKLKSKILVFKNTLNIEDLCKEKGWELLNPSARFSDIAENKISQVSWLGELSSLLPPHSVDMVKNIKWNKKPFILQWSHGHTGDGTILIQNEKDESLDPKYFRISFEEIAEADCKNYLNETSNYLALHEDQPLSNELLQLQSICTSELSDPFNNKFIYKNETFVYNINKNSNYNYYCRINHSSFNLSFDFFILLKFFRSFPSFPSFPSFSPLLFRTEMYFPS
jgi:hypothetical protein